MFNLNFSKNKKLYKYLLILFAFLFVFSIIVASITYYYPIRSFSSNLSKPKFSPFVTSWPISAIDLEFQERKRLKRYAKAEKKRRLERQLQKMNVLNVPIYDLNLDEDWDFKGDNSLYAPRQSEILWPVLPYSQKSSTSGYLKSSSLLVIPDANWSSIYEGIYLEGGSEIKATVPILKEKRSLSFKVFPLAPGNLRILLGQYVWAHSFSVDDIHKLQKIVIPINDLSATTIHLMSISFSGYLVDLSVNQIIKNAREPIQLSRTSLYWSSNPKYLHSQTKGIPNTDFVVEDDDLSEIEESSSPQQDTTIKENELYSSPIVSSTDSLPSTFNSAEVFLPGRASKYPLEANDPIAQVANPQQLSSNEYTTAYGYNIVLIQFPRINTEFLNDKNILNKVAPNINSLINTAAFFDKNIEIEKKNISLFRSTILNNYNESFEENLPYLHNVLSEHEDKNVYYKFRKYGYKVVSIATSQALLFAPGFSSGTGFSGLNNRWLSVQDTNLQNRTIQIDEKQSSVSGLDAIFKAESSKKTLQPLSFSDFQQASGFLKGISQNLEAIPRWHPNQYLLISAGEGGVQKSIYAFQNWVIENPQNRFFAHILLPEGYNGSKPSLGSFRRSVFASGLFTLFKPRKISELSTLSLADMALENVMDTIKARHVQNRTILFLLFPDSYEENRASGLYVIPGLYGRKDTHHLVTMSDVTSTLFSSIGIPSGKNIQQTTVPSAASGNMLEVSRYINDSSVNTSQNDTVKYTMIMKSGKNGCQPFLWKSNGSAIFDMKGDNPSYEVIGKNTLKFYPCSFPKAIETFTWYQKTFSQLNLGGKFYYLKAKNDYPHFFAGPSLISFYDPIFFLQGLNSSKINDMFFVSEKNLNHMVKYVQKSFSVVDGFEQSSDTKVAFFLSKF